MGYKILFSNLGYARGINGSLLHHLAYFSRYFYTRHIVQKRALGQLKNILDAEDPDLCCFVEIDQGSLHVGRFDQIGTLKDKLYRFHDITDKYGPQNSLRHMPFHKGKSNAFLSKNNMQFEKHYLTYGSKKLFYKINLPGDIVLFFAHFSLNRRIRSKQFNELKNHLGSHSRNIVLGDFNIMHGFSELEPLLAGTDLKIINHDKEFTFRFLHRKHVLDLCLCSKEIAEKISLNIIPQPFSDHAALLVKIDI